MAEIEDVMGLISALRAEVEQESITPERLGYVLQCMVDRLSSLIPEICLVQNVVVLATIDDLPETPSSRAIGYLIGGHLYVYVGTGGDVKDGKYKDCGGFDVEWDRVQLKTRPGTNGMGFKILDPSASFSSQVTDTNTIYVVQNDFELSSDFTMPSGCILRFDGGSIFAANNTAPILIFADTWVEGAVSISVMTGGTLVNEEAWMWWFGDDVDLWHTFINEVDGVVKYNYSAGSYVSKVRVTKRAKESFVVEGNGAEVQVRLEDFNICCRWEKSGSSIVRRCDSGKNWFYVEPYDTSIAQYDIIEDVSTNSTTVTVASLSGRVVGSNETRELQIGDCIAIRDSAIASFNPERDYRSCEFAFVTDIKEVTIEEDGVERTVYKVKLNHKVYGHYGHINSRYVLPSGSSVPSEDDEEDDTDVVDAEDETAEVIDDVSVLDTSYVPIEANQFKVIHVSIRDLKLRCIDMEVNDDYKQANKPSSIDASNPPADTAAGVIEPAKYHKGIAIYRAIVSLSNVETYDFTTGISLIRCQYSHVRDCVCVANKQPGEAETSADNEGYKSSMSYGLSISNCQHVVVDGGRYEGGSHGIVGGGNYDNRLAVVNRFIEISNTQTKSFKPDWNASIDAHGNAEYYTVRNNIAGAISLSGSNHTVEGNIAKGVINIHALTYNHKIRNNTCTGLEVWWMPKPKYNKVYNNWVPSTSRESLEITGNRFSATCQVLIRSTAAYYPNSANICLTFSNNILSSRVIFKLYPSGSGLSYNTAGEIVCMNNDFKFTSTRGSIIGRKVKLSGNIIRGSVVTNVAADKLVITNNVFDGSCGLLFTRSYYNRVVNGVTTQVNYARGYAASSVDFSYNTGNNMSTDMFEYSPEDTNASSVRVVGNVSDSGRYSILVFSQSVAVSDLVICNNTSSRNVSRAFIVDTAASVSYNGNRSMTGVVVPKCTSVTNKYDLENHLVGATSSRPAANMLNFSDLKLYYDTTVQKMLRLKQSVITNGDPLVSFTINPTTKRWNYVDIESLSADVQTAISTGNFLRLQSTRGTASLFAFATNIITDDSDNEVDLEALARQALGNSASDNDILDYFEKELGLKVLLYKEGEQYDTYKYFKVPDTSTYKYIYAQIASTSGSSTTFYLRALESSWVDLDGRTPAISKGTTSERPTLASGDAGFQYFDTTLGKAIIWTGSAWIEVPKISVVEELPASPDSNTLYLIEEASS